MPGRTKKKSGGGQNASPVGGAYNERHLFSMVAFLYFACGWKKERICKALDVTAYRVGKVLTQLKDEGIAENISSVESVIIQLYSKSVTAVLEAYEDYEKLTDDDILERMAAREHAVKISRESLPLVELASNLGKYLELAAMERDKIEIAKGASPLSRAVLPAPEGGSPQGNG